MIRTEMIRAALKRGVAGELISLALAAALVGGVVLWVTALSGNGGGPSGTIGYRIPTDVVWVNAADRTLAEAPGLRVPIEQPERGWVFDSPDGSRIAFVEVSEGGAWLRVGTPESSKIVSQLADASSPQLVDSPKGKVLETDGVPLVVAWSPEGDRIAYGSVTGEPFVLKVAEGPDWVERSYEMPEGYVGEAVWSPDGRYLAVSTYAGRDHTVYALDMGTGEMAELSDGCHIVWSPDSEYMAIHRDPHRENGVWIVRADGGGSEKLTGNVNAYPFAWVSERVS